MSEGKAKKKSKSKGSNNVPKENGSTDRYLKDRGWVKASDLPINEEGFRCCRYCNGSVKPPKRTFCSESCVHKHRLRSDGTYLRQQVYLRDRGICAICNIDTKQTARLLHKLKGDEHDAIRDKYNIHKKRKVTSIRKNGGGLWDADHIVRVIDGGGECGLDNIRTLCISCHKIITFG